MHRRPRACACPGAAPVPGGHSAGAGTGRDGHDPGRAEYGMTAATGGTRWQPAIGAAALAAALGGAAPPVLLDVRWRLGGPPGLDRYRDGHLPGARFADLDRDLAGPPGPGGGIRCRTRARSRRRCAGPGSATAGPWWSTTRTTRWPPPGPGGCCATSGTAGARVLDGGYQAWLAADEPIETGPAPAPAAGTFTARPGHLPLLDAAAAARLAAEGVLLDARAAERYRGETEPVDPVAGHIPARSARPPRPTSPPTAGSATRMSCVPGSRASAWAPAGRGAGRDRGVLRVRGDGRP